MNPDIVKLLEDDKDDTIHPDADVEAFGAALNREVSPSQQSVLDAGVIHHKSNPVSNQLFTGCQDSSQEVNVEIKCEQNQNSSKMDRMQQVLGSENQEQQVGSSSREKSHLLSQQEEYNQQTKAVQNVPKSAAAESHTKLLSTHMLLSVVRPHLDKDRDMHLMTLYSKLTKKEICLDVFVRNMRNIAGEVIFKQAMRKVIAVKTQQAKTEAVQNTQNIPHQIQVPSHISSQLQQDVKMPPLSASEFTDSLPLLQTHPKGQGDNMLNQALNKPKMQLVKKQMNKPKMQQAKTEAVPHSHNIPHQIQVPSHISSQLQQDVPPLSASEFTDSHPLSQAHPKGQGDNMLNQPVNKPKMQLVKKKKNKPKMQQEKKDAEVRAANAAARVAAGGVDITSKWQRMAEHDSQRRELIRNHALLAKALRDNFLQDPLRLCLKWIQC